MSAERSNVFDFGAAATGLIQHRQIQIGLGTLQQTLLHRLVLGNCRIPVSLRRTETAIARHTEQIPRGNDAHGFHRIAQQRRQQRRTLRRRQERADRPHGAFAYLRRRVLQILRRQFQRLFARIKRQLREQGRALNRRQIAALQLLIQRIGSPRLTIADQPQAFVITRCLRCAGGAPQFELRGDLVASLALMAGQAGIRRAEFLRTHRVGNAEAVVMAEIVAHVELAGHMAIHALRTRLAHGVTGVFDGIVVLRLQALAVDAFD